MSSRSRSGSDSGLESRAWLRARRALPTDRLLLLLHPVTCSQGIGVIIPALERLVPVDSDAGPAPKPAVMSPDGMWIETLNLINEKEEQIIKNRKSKIREEKIWRDREVRFRDLEKQWWEVDRKRVCTDQRAEQLSILAELAAFVSGFQMVMLYELEFPAIDENRHNSVLLSFFGLSCLMVACVNICIVFLANLLAIDLFNDSARELPWSVAPDEGVRLPPGCYMDPNRTATWMVHLDGSSRGECYCYMDPLSAKENAVTALSPRRPVEDAQENEHEVRLHYRRRVARMQKAFKYTAPFFMLNVGLSTLLKFYMSPAAGWSGWTVALIGMLAWYIGVQYMPRQNTDDSERHDE